MAQQRGLLDRLSVAFGNINTRKIVTLGAIISILLFIVSLINIIFLNGKATLT